MTHPLPQKLWEFTSECPGPSPGHTGDLVLQRTVGLTTWVGAAQASTLVLPVCTHPLDTRGHSTATLRSWEDPKPPRIRTRSLTTV